ncbi:MAG: uracil-DNA glycosylase [Candidatus Gracilibacteria bacterium]|nr:uracil-DNA glycosylase [Candidatus Gracilibacteria bacterium]
MSIGIHPSWQKVLANEFTKPYWRELDSFVKDEYSKNACFPEKENIFRAFDLTPFDTVKVIILGQDPYHTPGAAMGMCFSVPNESKSQPSLGNIFKELAVDMKISRTQKDLTHWAEQGVLLLNSVLTVRSHEAASHQGKGWEIFTDEVIRLLSEKREHLVFILWGNYAISKQSLIDEGKHLIITSPHPSPFSAYKGFFGSRPFSRTNEYLKKWGMKEIEW